MRTVIIDDEKLAREMLAAFLSKLTDFTLVGMARNTKEAASLLQNESVDLLLLDIEMPLGKGTDFLRKLSQPPLVIFTTAYKRYALEGYDFNPVDYLLKPIGFTRFEAALQKARRRFETNQKAMAYDKKDEETITYLTVKEGHTMKKLVLDRITHISAMREYVCYHSDEGRTMELKSISSVSKRMADVGFIRIHRSYLVAKSAVQSFDTNRVTLFSGETLPIGRTYRKEVMNILV